MRLDPRRWTPLAGLFAVFLLAGAGCALDQKIGWRLPFSLDPSAEVGDAAAASKSVALKPGLTFTVRPSTLGVSGSVDQVLGLDANAVRVKIKEAAADRRIIDWQGASASGTLELKDYADAHAMLLPAFWQTGDVQASHEGGLWFSRGAYDDLVAGHNVDWKLGLADNALSALSSALKSFNALAFKMIGPSLDAPEVSPFDIRKTGMNDAFPLTIDGKIVLFRTIQASSWFADFVILDNPDNPLILKVSVNPAAGPALKLFEPAHVQWDELGYEITALERP